MILNSVLPNGEKKILKHRTRGVQSDKTEPIKTELNQIEKMVWIW